MAKVIPNEKGFLIIEVSSSEMIDKLAKYGSLGLCDSCLNTDDNGKYIAVLNQWFCSSCYDEWINRATRYTEDIPFEECKFNQYKKLLNPTDE